MSTERRRLVQMMPIERITAAWLEAHSLFEENNRRADERFRKGRQA